MQSCSLLALPPKPETSKLLLVRRRSESMLVAHGSATCIEARNKGGWACHGRRGERRDFHASDVGRQRTLRMLTPRSEGALRFGGFPEYETN